MTDLMIDEQIEHIRAYLASEEADDVYINLAYTRAMLAIIDELQKKNAELENVLDSFSERAR